MDYVDRLAFLKKKLVAFGVYLRIYGLHGWTTIPEKEVDRI